MVDGLKSNFPKKLLLASPRGFCAGVKRAIDTLNQLVKTHPGQTIYCYHQIVHNTHVVAEFEEKGVKFVNSIDEVPKGSIIVFSSHGVSPLVRLKAEDRRLTTIDATCPYVIKTHLEVKKYASEGDKIIYIGKPQHDEAVGTTGEALESTVIVQTPEEVESLEISPTEKVALVTQTTLSYDETEDLRKAMRKKFPQLIEPLKSDICMATQNRQNGVKELVKKEAELVIVLGSANSSNSNKLKKVAENMGAKAVLIDDISELDLNLLEGISCVGLTAGASLPEQLITEAITWFKEHGTKTVEEVVTAKKSFVSSPPVKIT
ncbi:MAG: 4-hydroxy-3-methylbut-2-enyl diphosphate reductase [bacterium]|nr:4-hydroxy-3-methylbut-2-enyl diphosphate reductase [bacterium]